MSSGCDVRVWCMEAFQRDSAALCLRFRVVREMPACFVYKRNIFM